VYLKPTSGVRLLWSFHTASAASRLFFITDLVKFSSGSECIRLKNSSCGLSLLPIIGHHPGHEINSEVFLQLPLTGDSGLALQFTNFRN
jgi:hypothetical protein